MVKDEKGFTLIEMLIVLFIISILILVTVPNVTKHFSSIDNKGCEAFKSMVQAQVEAYKIDYLEYPTLNQLEKAGYIEKDAKCPNGKTVEIDTVTGKVSEKKAAQGSEGDNTGVKSDSTKTDDASGS